MQRNESPEIKVKNDVTAPKKLSVNSWIEKMSLNKTNSNSSSMSSDNSDSSSVPAKRQYFKTYRRSSFSALIVTPLLKRNEKKKNNVLRKAMSASTASLSSSTSYTLGRIYLRVSYDPVTHVLSVTVIQSNKLQRSDRQKLFPRVQFHLSLVNGENRSVVYKTNSVANLDLIDIKESFYFPNVEQSSVNNSSINVLVSGKDKVFFSTEKILSEGSLLLDNLVSGEQLYCSVLMEECQNATELISKKDQMFSSSINTSINSSRLEIGLTYDTLLGYLTVEVNRGLNLFDQFTTDKAPSTYVKLVLMNVESELHKVETEHQTTVIKSCSNPNYNETFEFNIPSYDLESYSLYINVYSKRILSKSNLIGCVVFDNQPKHNQFVEHLYEAVSSDGDLITRCHPLI